MAERRFRLIILGAGFSAPAGVPLAQDLWKEVRNRARRFGSESKFTADLATYQAYLEECEGRLVPADAVDFEEFLGFLDVEFHLGLRGKDTWSSDGNETQVIVKTLIGEILAEGMPPPGAIPPLYLEFASRLEAGDTVITFNYDVLLERALDEVGKPYRLFPDRDNGETAYEGPNEVLLLKPHGSIDWFDRSGYLRMCQAFEEQGAPDPPTHPVFNGDLPLTVEPLIDGPSPNAENLGSLFRVHEIEDLYRNPIMFRATPWILSPSPAKILFTSRVKDFWWGVGRMGGYNLGLAIIGFSLPPQDEYARQAIWRLVTNYQQSWWDETYWEGLQKSRLALVDRRRSVSDREGLWDRYRFVDRDRAIVWFDGFDEESLEVVFNSEG